ncbi:MAG: DUF2213 domain-containing protein [Candidatus Thermoplasmatota archaeon]|nr:DUF2213 domain-containing protein [Candidatus Thermoplasmatota archaeon]
MMVQSNLTQVISNFAGNIRYDWMEGQRYLVAPMVMLVEGVHAGSGGPLYYPSEELSKTPEMWNHKPIVVYHPEINGKPTSACDPDILTSRKVGVIMHSRFEEGKLKAEAWLNEDRLKAVDKRILDHLEKGQMMELSTGLFTDNEEVEGEWNGESYVAIARNYRPDHLALLPDLVGACSIRDGAGFLRLNKDPHLSSLQEAIQSSFGKDHQLVDIQGSDVIFNGPGGMKKTSFIVENDKAILKGSAQEVEQIVTYQVKTNDEDLIMLKEQMVEALIKNDSTKWSEEDREVLMNLDEVVLGKMDPVVNENPDPEPEPEPESEPEINQKPERKMTVDEYIGNAPPEMQSILKNMREVHQAEKRRLVGIITSNEKNVFTEKCLMSKEIEELKALAALARKDEEPEPSLDYSGQGPVDNGKESPEPLPLPTINWKES